MKRRSFLQVLGIGPAAVAVGVVAQKAEATAMGLKFDEKVAALAEPVQRFDDSFCCSATAYEAVTWTVAEYDEPIHLKTFDES